MNTTPQIANIYYPKKRLITKDDKTLTYVFQINEEYYDFSLVGISPYRFLEYNDKEELIVRKNFKTVIVYNKALSLKEKILNLKNRKHIEFSLEEKIIQFFSLSNNTYLISSYDSEGIHYVTLLGNDLQILKKQKVGHCSWHGQNAMCEKDKIIMYAEYNTSEDAQRVSIFRSKDMGYTWKEVFFLNAPNQLRHWHTIHADISRDAHWIATTGDTPAQSKWFLSQDDGDTWNEITDKYYVNTAYPSRNLSAHRTTAILESNSHYYWTTDDLMGNVINYFIEENGERKSSSKFYKSKKNIAMDIEKLTNLGIHGRSFIKTEHGYLVVTEAKYVSNNMQIFYIDESDPTKAYFLLSLPGTMRTGGTYSINSPMNREQECYLKLGNKSYFLGEKIQTLKLLFKQKQYNDTLLYDIRDYFAFEEHLWFVNNIKSLDNIHFTKNKVSLSLKDTKNIFYLMLGDAKQQNLKNKELFYLNSAKNVLIDVTLTKKSHASIIMYIELFDDNSVKSKTSYRLNVGKNNILHPIKEDEKYVKLMFRVSCHTENTIELSQLMLTLT